MYVISSSIALTCDENTAVLVTNMHSNFLVSCSCHAYLLSIHCVVYHRVLALLHPCTYL